jgi:hypothetical protein
MKCGSRYARQEEREPPHCAKEMFSEAPAGDGEATTRPFSAATRPGVRSVSQFGAVENGAHLRAPLFILA